MGTPVSDYVLTQHLHHYSSVYHIAAPYMSRTVDLDAILAVFAWVRSVFYTMKLLVTRHLSSGTVYGPYA